MKNEPRMKTRDVVNKEQSSRSSLDVANDYGWRQRAGFLLGPLLFFLLMIMPEPSGLSPEGKAVLASTVWIAIWWVTEPIPIPATSLLPLFVFPATGVMSPGDSAGPYANPLIFLFLGGFMIALAVERWGLHRRIALLTIRTVGDTPARLILGFMVASAFLSMWISNTAAAMMMTPIGMAVIMQVAKLAKDNDLNIDTSQGNFQFGTALMLGIAYACSIGGVGTLIGTPPNLVFAAAANEMFGLQVGFAQWMAFGIPVAVLGLALCWWYLTKVAFTMELDRIPGGVTIINQELAKLGPMRREEKCTLGVFVLVALSWITRQWLISPLVPGIEDSTIAIIGALLLFLIPVNLREGKFLLDWTSAQRVPWGLLLLFGGGLSIARGFTSTDLASWIGGQLTAFADWPLLALMFATTVLVKFLSEVTSNTATGSMMMPIMGSLALAIGVHPYALMITACVAASFAFMLPVATPPNAVVFGSGYISITQMARAGFGVSVLSVFLVALLTYYLLPLVLGINLFQVPMGL